MNELNEAVIKEREACASISFREMRETMPMFDSTSESFQRGFMVAWLTYKALIRKRADQIAETDT